MRRTKMTETQTETKVLGAMALACYAATLASMLAFGHLLLAFALRALGTDFALLLTPAGV